MYVVIMAGGGGTRLWPLSQPERPKPFLPLTGPESLLQATARRLLDGPELAGLEASSIAVVTDRRYDALVREQLPGVMVVSEPVGRNTAPAIALAVLALDRPEDEVMLVLPADQRIDPAREGRFRQVIADAAGGLASGSFGIGLPLVTLGVTPTHAATEYGYLVPRRADGQRIRALDAYPLEAFEEKPAARRATELLASGGVAWNAGMFLWQRGAIRDALARYTHLLDDLAPAIGSPEALAAAYDHVDARSIDYAVMEPAARDRRVVMASLDVGWSDLGGWPALLDALGHPADGGVIQAGQQVSTTSDDLIVERGPAGLTVRPGSPGTMTPERPVAVLRRALAARPAVEALLGRCSAAEARA